MKQQSIEASGFEKYRKKTRKESHTRRSSRSQARSDAQLGVVKTEI
jgi:hypothetical protein